jgi:hypothetical protein
MFIYEPGFGPAMYMCTNTYVYVYVRTYVYVYVYRGGQRDVPTQPRCGGRHDVRSVLNNAKHQVALKITYNNLNQQPNLIDSVDSDLNIMYKPQSRNTPHSALALKKLYYSTLMLA